MPEQVASIHGFPWRKPALLETARLLSQSPKGYFCGKGLFFSWKRGKLFVITKKGNGVKLDETGLELFGSGAV